MNETHKADPPKNCCCWRVCRELQQPRTVPAEIVQLVPLSSTSEAMRWHSLMQSLSTMMKPSLYLLHFVQLWLSLARQTHFHRCLCAEQFVLLSNSLNKNEAHLEGSRWSRRWLNPARTLGTANVTIRASSFTSATKTDYYLYAGAAGLKLQRKTSNGED